METIYAYKSCYKCLWSPEKKKRKKKKRCKRIKKSDGSSFVVNFKYEKLHTFCFICGRLGHTESFCDQLFSKESGEITRDWGVCGWRQQIRRVIQWEGDKWLRAEDGKEPMIGRNFPSNSDDQQKGKEVSGSEWMKVTRKIKFRIKFIIMVLVCKILVHPTMRGFHYKKSEGWKILPDP